MTQPAPAMVLLRNRPAIIRRRQHRGVHVQAPYRGEAEYVHQARTTSELPKKTTRREALKAGAAATVLASVAVPKVHAANDSTIRLALIGTGNRGSGAVGNAIGAAGVVGCNVKLVAMADIQEKRLAASHKALSDRFPEKVDVPAERQFVGFDAYRKAIDCLKPGDVAMLTAHAGFRRVHFDYAVDQGINVFMEKVLRSRSRRTETHVASRQTGGEEEPQDRLRPHVPPIRPTARP